MGWMFQAACHERHPVAGPFASLTSEQQIEYLTGVDQTPFFNTTRLLTLLGMFSLPTYGGNRDGEPYVLGQEHKGPAVFCSEDHSAEGGAAASADRGHRRA